MFERRKKITHQDQIPRYLIDAVYEPGVIVVESLEGQPASYYGPRDSYRTTRSLYSPLSRNRIAPKSTAVDVDIARETGVARVLVRRPGEHSEVERHYLEAQDWQLDCLHFGVEGLYRAIRGNGRIDPVLEERWDYATNAAAEERLLAKIAEATESASQMIEDYRHR